MKSVLSLIAILSIAQISSAESSDKSHQCPKYPAINVTLSQIAGEWIVYGYGSSHHQSMNETNHHQSMNKTSHHSTLKCQKRKFTVNADGVTGSVETSNADPSNPGKLRTVTAPMMESSHTPGVIILGAEPGSNAIRVLTALYLDSNVFAYHLLTSPCFKGEKINEPRIAVKNVNNVKASDLEKILQGLPTYADYKEFREISRDCPK